MATCAGIFAECTCTVAQAARLCGGWRRNRLYLPAVIFDKLCAIYESVLKLDPHIPLVCPGVRELIDRISPEYITYEFITSDRAQHSAYIDAQNAALGYIPPHS